MERLRRRASVCGRRFWLVLATGLSVTGCGDHRIGLDKFLEMREQMENAQMLPEAIESQEATPSLLDRRWGPYKVGPSDVLSVVLTQAAAGELFPVLQVRVDRKGEIDLPIIGPIQVADMELEDVEDALRNAYVPQVFKDAVVHVELVSVDSTDVLVVGAVTLPGLVQLRRTERDMLHAIVAAGGVSELASGRATLRRIRRPPEEVILNLTDPEECKAALALDPLEDGDILTVQAATPNTVFVGGLVNFPRPQIYPPGVGVSVLQAIAAAGGLRTDVTPREGTLIRRLPAGNDVQVKLDLDRITTGQDPNIMLAAGDILWVPDTLETRVQDWINRNIFIRAGISATANVNYNATGVEFLNRNAERSSAAFQRGIEETYDPFGSLIRNAALQGLSQPAPPTGP